MLDIFDILGPIMVGPSSSHTAGAVRIGNIARTLLGNEPVEAKLLLHGSFAETGRGHGTDRALVAGLLGMQPDDLDIPNSFALARERGLHFTFGEVQLREAHPNTVVLDLTGRGGEHLKVQACSIGGGRIQVDKLDDVPVGFTGEYNTLIIYNQDDCGYVSEVSKALSQAQVNIANMRLRRQGKGGLAIMVIEVDQKIPQSVITSLRQFEGIRKATYYEREEA